MDHINIRDILFVYWRYNLYFNDGNCFFRICFTLGSNELLAATVITNFLTVIPYFGLEILF
jgi:hypothetical protein